MLLRKALIAASLLSATSAFAAVPEINCSGDGIELKLEIESGTGLGTLTYTLDEQTSTIEGLDTSFVDDVGAATKGGDVLLYVTPVGSMRIGQLILSGKTYRVRCD